MDCSDCRYYQGVAGIFEDNGWPIFLAVVIWYFREEIKKSFGRITRVGLAGAEFAPLSQQPLGHEDFVIDEPYAFGRLVVSAGDEGSAVTLGAGVHSDPDRRARVAGEWGECPSRCVLKNPGSPLQLPCAGLHR
jgi:hypothetical protein